MRSHLWTVTMCLAASFAPLLAPALPAQTGGGGSCCESVTSHVRAGVMTSNEGDGLARHQWLQAVVLWRAAGELPSMYPHDSIALIERANREARSASAELGRQFLGGVYAEGYQYAEYSRDRRVLWVNGREFALPRRDSALIVMVDVGASGSGPTVVGATYIRAEMPDGYWSKTWTSGDTTFMIRPRDPHAVLVQALEASPLVHAFLDASAPR